ncbi:MAG: PKD domain-containing protein [Bacteroidota bacterium]
MLRRIFIIFFFFISTSLLAQDKSNRGKEFWLGYGFDYSFFHESPVNFQELAIYISTDQQPANVTITINGTSYIQNLTIPANTADATILIPKSGMNDARVLTDGLSTKGIHVVSDVPVAAYSHVYSTQVSGATMLMPVDTYGYLYYSVNYNQSTSNSSLPAISPTTANGNDWYSWFYAIASEDNTRLEITPADSTKNGWLPGQTYTVNLNKGEMYHVFGKLINGSSQAYAASKDMTGSKVLSVAGSDGRCHPIGLFSGSGGMRICRGDGGEFMQQQVFPAQAWGTRYLTYHTINNINTDINETNRNYYRICVQDPTAAVKRNGVPLTGLTRNFYYEIMDSTGGDYITSDKPILVSQYTVNDNQCWRFPTTTPSPPSYGDPEMFFLSPIEQGQKSVLFYVSRKSFIDYVYANIHFPTVAVGSLLVDGAPVPAANIKAHPNLPSYSVALVRFTGAAAQHRITCDSTFTSTVYGLGNYESYGYNTGTLINNLNALPKIANTLNSNGKLDTFTCPKSPTRLFVKTAYRATTFNWLLSQAGGGMAPNTDSLINNPVIVDSNLVNGRRYYNYTLQQDFTFTTPGTYYIPVVYTSPEIDNCNHTDTARIQIIVKPGPVADFTTNTVLCVQDTARFTGTSIPGIYNIDRWLWTFDDNTTANTVNAKKRFVTAGSHDVKYRIIADNGCVADTMKTFSFLGSPVAKFGYDRNICVGDSIKFSDSSTIAVGTIANWKWNFGDGNFASYSNNSSFYHRYILAGTYVVSLVATSASGCSSDTFKLTVTVNFKPLAKFGVQNANICLGDSIRFSDSSSIAQGSLTGWRWNFGDGSTANYTNANPFYHPYALPGSYTVSLVVSPSNGCVSDTFKLPVSVGVKPVAKFGINNISICQRDSVRISDSSTVASGTISSWKWNFGDGITVTRSNNTTFFHPYALPGVYTISLVTVPAVGCVSDTFKRTITVSVKANAKFGIHLNNICLGDSIRISDSSNISQGNITSWRWNFGDGNTAVNLNSNPFYHPYSLPGSYSVSLTVTSGTGCVSDTFKLPVSVGVKPVAKFGINNAVICQRDSIRITDSSNVASGTIASWKWNFGDGNTASYSNNNAFYHSYALPGTYTLSLVAVPAVGCVSDTFKRTVTVTPKPLAKFGFDRNICVGDSIKFSDSSVYNNGFITNWQWNFGDGNTVNKTDKSPFYHHYTTAGPFTVTLVVTPNTGCTDTFRLSVGVAQKPTASFVYTGIPCEDSVLRFTPTSVSNGYGLQTWYWDFGNGQIVSATNPNPVLTPYNAPASSVVVKHVAGISAGCISDTAYQTLVIHANTVADFSMTGDTICENTALQFLSIDNPADSIDNWAWSFGDGSFASSDSLSKSYSQAGTYNVSLRVKNKFGCGSLPASKPVTINKMPVVDAGPSFAVFTGTTVRFAPTVNDSLLFSFRWEPSFTGLIDPDSLRPSLFVDQNQTFTLTATGAGNCVASDTMQVRVLSALKIINAFSPNGDGINDVWILPGLEDYLQATVRIFDRYGRIVYSSTGYPKPWDGKVNGTILPVGTYYYIIDTKTDFVKPFTGAVTLLK